MGKRYLIDSNVIIDFCNGKLPVNGKEFLKNIEPEISIITNIEIFATKNIAPEEFTLLEKFIEIALVHPVNIDLIETTIKIRQSYKLKLPDALIAATAIVNGLELITSNISDFRNIQGLQVINPSFV